MLLEFKENDVRYATYTSRIEIGFGDKREEWKHAPALFTDQRLEIQGHPVMEAWEHPYMQELARTAAQPGGKILEVGFGMGISAEYLQQHDAIDEHVIIEGNNEVFQRLLKFQLQAKNSVTPLFGLWHEIVPKLTTESFDGILFDTYPLTNEEIHSNHFSFFEHAYRLLKKGGVLTYYSDEISEYSDVHYRNLRSAGFSDIQSRICRVTPPSSCLYWKSDTILVPIITK